MKQINECAGRYAHAKTEEGEMVVEKDNWIHKSKEMTCGTCMHNCSFRCRRHAPTMQGWPAVYPTDWCGDHKLDKVTMEKLAIQKGHLHVS